VTAQVLDAQPLIDTIKAAVAASGVAIGEGKKPAVAAGRPYIVAFFDSGTIGNRSLVSRDGFSVYASFQCAGLTPESARFAVTKLRVAVQSLFLATVGGRTVQMPTHEIALPMSRDNDADPPLFIQIDEWRFRLS
jgi:hypothetical protein